MPNLAIVIVSEILLIILFGSLTYTSYKNLDFIMNGNRKELYRLYNKSNLKLGFEKILSRKKVDYGICVCLGTLLLVLIVSTTFYHACELLFNYI